MRGLDADNICKVHSNERRESGLTPVRIDLGAQLSSDVGPGELAYLQYASYIAYETLSNTHTSRHGQFVLMCITPMLCNPQRGERSGAAT
jgi:hypothetical protein